MTKLQTYFSFDPIEEELGEYFVEHSGVSSEYRRAIALLESKPENEGLILYVYGPKGSGKSHFIKALQARVHESTSFIVYRLGTLDGSIENDITKLISDYQEAKSQGGIVVFEADLDPSSISNNPHLRSRLLAGEIFSLTYPQEEELRPVLKSLLERYHLRLKEDQLEKILQSVPAIPEYFELVSKSLTRLIGTNGKFKGSVLKEVLDIRSL